MQALRVLQPSVCLVAEKKSKARIETKKSESSRPAQESAGVEIAPLLTREVLKSQVS